MSRSSSCVQVWVGDLSGTSIGPQRDVLSPSELSRAARYRRRRDADRFIKARGLLRTVLARNVGAPAAALRIADKDIKPALIDFPDMYFNTSHCGDQLAIAVAPLPVGIDIEAVHPDVDPEPVVQSYFHPMERDVFFRLPHSDRLSGFYRIWTQKEAFVKALGCGVSKSLTSFAVDPEGGVIVCPQEPQPDRAWFGTLVDAIPGFCLALVCRHPRPMINISELSREDE